MQIYYRNGYKYQLVEDYVAQTAVSAKYRINTYFISLDCGGKLLIKRGYAWDGPSGPTFDTKNFMRGSLIHDALYQLIREGYLHPNERKKADEELRRICLEDGMWPIRAWWVYHGVRLGGEKAAMVKRQIFTAP